MIGPPPAGCWAPSDTWYCFEVHVVRDTANSNAYPSNIYVDDIGVATQRIGCN